MDGCDGVLSGCGRPPRCADAWQKLGFEEDSCLCCSWQVHQAAHSLRLLSLAFMESLTIYGLVIALVPPGVLRKLKQ